MWPVPGREGGRLVGRELQPGRVARWECDSRRCHGRHLSITERCRPPVPQVVAQEAGWKPGETWAVLHWFPLVRRPMPGYLQKSRCGQAWSSPRRKGEVAPVRRCRACVRFKALDDADAGGGSGGG